jgi:hypothetical protein
MRNIYICLMLAYLYSSATYSCTISDSAAFASLKVEGGAVVFDAAPIADDMRDPSQPVEIGINVNYYDCLLGKKTLIGELPYLAATGEVDAAFIANNMGADELFVLHRVNVRSDTGIPYAGDYYTVLAYNRIVSGFAKNDRLSNYFGSGGDILSSYDSDVLAYEFPYKSEGSIKKRLSSPNYLKWLQGDRVALISKGGALLREDSLLTETNGSLIAKKTSLIQKNIEAGWILVTTENSNFAGWITCEEVESC